MTPEQFSGYNPGCVVVMGDVHGNEQWMRTRIPLAGDALGYQPARIIVQLGDFGNWRDSYLDAVSEVAVGEEVIVAFLDGNHENHNKLHALNDTGGPVVRVRENLYWIQRGTRWTWQDRTWMALGGAISPDKATRSVGMSWFAEEEITLLQAFHSIDGGTVDVLLTHDYPPQVPHGLPQDQLPEWWDRADLARGEYHRRLLERIAGYVEPEWWFHGHAHYEHRSRVMFPWGPVEMAGMDMDGSAGNWQVLNIADMVWEGNPYGNAEH